MDCSGIDASAFDDCIGELNRQRGDREEYETTVCVRRKYGLWVFSTLKRSRSVPTKSKVVVPTVKGIERILGATTVGFD
jgi:hypothetical protein